MYVGPHIADGLESFETPVGIDSVIVSNLPGINVALLKLTKPINYNDYIQPVCMDVNNARSFPAGTPCWVAGWEKESVITGKVLMYVLNQLFISKDRINVCTLDFCRQWTIPFRPSRSWHSGGELWKCFRFWSHLHQHHEPSFGKYKSSKSVSMFSMLASWPGPQSMQCSSSFC